MANKVYRKPSDQIHDRLPISTYDEAVRRLASLQLDAGHDEALDLAVSIVADIFWMKEARVRRDMFTWLRGFGWS